MYIWWIPCGWGFLQFHFWKALFHLKISLTMCITMVAINTAVEELVHFMSDLSAAGCTTVQHSLNLAEPWLYSRLWTSHRPHTCFCRWARCYSYDQGKLLYWISIRWGSPLHHLQPSHWPPYAYAPWLKQSANVGLILLRTSISYQPKVEPCLQKVFNHERGTFHFDLWKH